MCPVIFCALRARALIALHIRAVQELDGPPVAPTAKCRSSEDSVAMGEALPTLPSES